MLKSLYYQITSHKKITSISAIITIGLLLCACSDQLSDNTHDQANGHAAHEHEEKPIQHLKLGNILSLEEATTVFTKEVAFITANEELTAGILHEIHMSTYSLEKAVAYFVKNSQGEQKSLADQIAVVVEEIHLASENNRADDTRGFIDQLERLAQSADSFRSHNHAK